MQSRRRPNSDRSLEALESRLRALPHPPVPSDLGMRILAAIPAKATASHETPRLANEPASSQAPTLMFVQGSRRSLSEMPKPASFDKWLLLICISPMS